MNELDYSRRSFLKVAGLATASLPVTTRLFAKDIAVNRKFKQPNILWLSCEDISPHLGCYGDPNANTPTCDKLAKQGILYRNAFTTAGVCAPTRSCIITGVYASTLGTHHMRAGGEGVERSLKPAIPTEIKCFPEYLRKNGYYCTNNYKEDYSFNTPESAWDESSKQAHWRNRPNKLQPFFAVFNYTGTHEGSIRLNDEARAERTKRLKPSQRQDPNKLKLPPYYPDTPVTRDYWARYYELITALDYWIADKLQELKNEGVADDTIVFFWSDHGVGMPRAKRWVYDSGTHIPLIVRIPKKFRIKGQAKPGTKDERLVSTIDFGATVLNLAGIRKPDYMQGQSFIGFNIPAERKYIYGARDRMDERYDIIRTVRDKRYRYVRNYEPFKPYYQYMQSAESGPVMEEIRRVSVRDELPVEARIFMAETKPVEELYDLKKDPYEVFNLASDPKFAHILERMRKDHLAWMLETKDLGLIPEPELVELEKKYGNRYAILRQENSDLFMNRLQKSAILAGDPNKADLPELISTLMDECASVRYWAAIGLGNLGPEGKSAATILTMALNDKSPCVRVAAARGLCLMNVESRALPVLMQELKSPHEWVRLNAAITLDSLGEKARPAVDVLKMALDDKENKYVVRVANHALNTLLGTNNIVR